MANIKISQYPNAGSLNGNEYLEAVQNASNVKLSISTLREFINSTLNFDDIDDVVPVEKGGTGANNRNDALNSLLPSQTNKASHVLTSDGANSSWQAVGSAGLIPDGSIGTTQLQNEGVTFEKVQNIASGRILGRTTVEAGDIEQLSTGGGIIVSGGEIRVTGRMEKITTTSETLTAANSRNRTVSVQGQDITVVLPPLADLSVGDFVRITPTGFGTTVNRNGTDLIDYFQGGADITSVPLNRGTTITFIRGSRAWLMEFTFGVPFLHNHTTEIALCRGESCYYDFNNVSSIPLKQICAPDREYEISMTMNYVSGSLLTASPTYLQMNNVNYPNGFNRTYQRLSSGTNSTSGSIVGGNLPNVDNGFLLELQYAGRLSSCDVRLFTQTSKKMAVVKSYGYQSGVSNAAIEDMGIIANDTTSHWTSLGTIISSVNVSGRIRVKRVL